MSSDGRINRGHSVFQRLLKAYPRYTLVAEKLEAMVKLGLANSRMKDFYDIWLVSKIFSFDGELLRSAMTQTFARRRTTFPASRPFALTSAFYEDHQKQIQVGSVHPQVEAGNAARGSCCGRERNLGFRFSGY
jgi:hypothetical protein